MKNDTIDAAANDIARALFDSELAIESALGSVAALLTALPPFKAAASLTVFHAQDVLEQASELVGVLTQARRKAGDLHRRLGATQRQLGLEPIAFGPIGKPPAYDLSISELRQVG